MVDTRIPHPFHVGDIITQCVQHHIYSNELNYSVLRCNSAYKIAVECLYTQTRSSPCQRSKRPNVPFCK